MTDFDHKGNNYLNYLSNERGKKDSVTEHSHVRIISNNQFFDGGQPTTTSHQGFAFLPQTLKLVLPEPTWLILRQHELKRVLENKPVMAS